MPERFAEPAREGIGSAFAVAPDAGEFGPTIIAAAKDAFVEGWVQSMWGGVAMVATVIAYLVIRGKPAREAMGDDADALLDEGRFEETLAPVS